MFRRSIAMLAVLMMVLSACGAEPATNTPVPPPATSTTAPGAAGDVDLGAVKTYLLDQAAALKTSTAALKAAADAYYQAASGAKFDYAALWSNSGAATQQQVQTARDAWVAASPGYEKIEGIVAGVPSLAEYDVILDAGTSAAESEEDAVPFDLTLPDGTVLPKPGNLFGVNESTLWGTEPTFTAQGVEPDFDGDGTIEFGEALPDANVLKAAADALDSYTGEMVTAANGWTPTTSDAFTALVVMVPTMSEYFESWKNSRFVAGEASTQRDFVAISRLSDIVDILSGLEIVYSNVKPLAASADPAQADQIGTRLTDLRTFVAGVYEQEQGGKRFTAEEADTLGAEAQNQATAIAGQVSQIAGQLNIEIQA